MLIHSSSFSFFNFSIIIITIITTIITCQRRRRCSCTPPTSPLTILPPPGSPSRMTQNLRLRETCFVFCSPLWSPCPDSAVLATAPPFLKNWISVIHIGAVVKHHKNCESRQAQVTWKLKFKCQFYLSCLSCLSCHVMSCPTLFVQHVTVCLWEFGLNQGGNHFPFFIQW